MIFVTDFFNIQGTKAQIGRIEYDSSLVADLSNGIVVDSLPIEQLLQGQMQSGKFIDMVTHEITYEYVPIPLDLEQRLKLAESALNDLIMGV